MDDETLFPIGALAERTGVTVKTIRFYSDTGIVPPTSHSPAGYRLYDIDALARLELVRTLRELDIDLPTVRRVLARETSLAEVAAAHAAALDAQIRVLRLRRALFGAADANPAMVELLRTSMPDLPEEPAAEQVEAWMELVQLVQDNDFRAAVRRMAEYQERQRADGDSTGLHHDLTEAVRAEVGRALAAGMAPDAVEAAAVVNTLTARYAETFARPDDADLRRWIAERLEVANDARVTRYWQLVSTINNWPPMPDLAPIFAWFGRALEIQPHGHPALGLTIAPGDPD
ncbi:MerR family transcriptional regulator [Nocardia sp. NPDC051321]|uniref:MerR family transcriptional regulator n=1 Tax=Nocardia sp. NPDC051321 TaxID=3364323 RepID=UPI0037878486